MSDTTSPLPATDPLRSLVEEWSQSEVSRAEDLDRLIAPLEEAVGQLSEWADRVAQAERADAERQQAEAERQQAEAERWHEVEAREQAAEDRRRRLEHDLKLARARVRELEQALQERTEELLRAQAANNQLAAELQSIEEGDDALSIDPLEDEVFENFDPIENDEPAPENGETTNSEQAAEPDGGVAERFAKLRRS